jgi:hypothetical protein
MLRVLGVNANVDINSVDICRRRRAALGIEEAGSRF